MNDNYFKKYEEELLEAAAREESLTLYERMKLDQEDRLKIEAKENRLVKKNDCNEPKRRATILSKARANSCQSSSYSEGSQSSEEDTLSADDVGDHVSPSTFLPRW